jgi:hypothetical protein
MNGDMFSLVPDDSKFDDVTPGGVVAAVVAAGAGTLVELASSVPGLPAATGLAVQVVANLAGKSIEARQRRAAVSVQHAAVTANMSPEEFARLVAARPATLELAARALDAASRATMQHKILALGTALATGSLAEDDALIDQEMFIVQALAPLEAPHVNVLQLISMLRVPASDGNPYRKSYLTWAADDLAKRYPQAASTMDAILGALASVGAVTPSSEAALNGGTTYVISPFGRTLLDRLSAGASRGSS